MKNYYKKQKIIILYIICIIFLINFFIFPKNKDSNKELSIPKWFINPPGEKNAILTAGYAKKKNQQLAIVSASDMARAEISREIIIKIESVTKQFLEEAGINNESQISEFTEITSKSITSNILFFSKIIKQEVYKVDDRYVAYVLIKIDLLETKSAIDGTLNNYKDQFDKLNKKKELSTEDELEKLTDEINSKLYRYFNKQTYSFDEKRINYDLRDDRIVEDKISSGGKKPDWVINYPVSQDYYIGIGNGSTLAQAKDSAINTLVTQIQVNIKSEINDYIKETNGVTNEEVSQNIRLSLRENIEDLILFGLWESKEDDYWAYYRLNIENYKRKEQEKIENAKINGLDFLKKSDEENDPGLKFKFAFLGYYLVGRYVSRAIKVNYNGGEIILINELTSRMQKILNNIKINISSTNLVIDKINPKPITVEYMITYEGQPVNNFPIKFIKNKGNLDITERGFTDSDGKIACIINKAISIDALQSFLVQLDIGAFIEDAAESEEDILIYYNRISKLGLPMKETIVKVNQPVFNFELRIQNDLNNNRKYMDHVKSMSNNFKNIFSKKINATYVEQKTKLKLLMVVDGSISRSKDTGNFFTRLNVTISIIDTNTGEEIFTKSTPNRGIKGGSVTEEKSVREALDKYINEYNDKMLQDILSFIEIN